MVSKCCLENSLPLPSYPRTLCPKCHRQEQLITAVDGIINTSFNDTNQSSPIHDIRALTLRGYSKSEASATVRAQEASTATSFRQKRSAERQDRGIGAGDSTQDGKDVNYHRNNHRDHPIVYSEETRISKTAGAAKEGHWDDYAPHKKRQGRHGTLTRSWETGRHQNTVGELVSAEEERWFNAGNLMDSWHWG